MRAEDVQPTEDCILPAQFADMFRNKVLSPEKRLMLGILEDALQCYYGNGSTWYTNNHNTREGYHKEMSRKRLTLQNEAKAWLFEEIPTLPWCLSLEDCCHALSINCEWFRSRVRNPPVGKIPRQHIVSHRVAEKPLRLHQRDEVTE